MKQQCLLNFSHNEHAYEVTKINVIFQTDLGLLLESGFSSLIEESNFVIAERSITCICHHPLISAESFNEVQECSWTTRACYSHMTLRIWL